MLYDVIFLCILAALVYSYTTSRNQFAATATAIRDIWSGTCQLSCRQSGNSDYSGFSGLSGLQGQPRALDQNPMKSNAVSGQGQFEAHGNVTGPSSNCNCESCPCALIENFLRTCQPACNIYAEIARCTERCATYLWQMFEDIYDTLMRTFECNRSCQRQAQLLGTSNIHGSDDNFNFRRGDNEIPTIKSIKENFQETLPDNLQENSKKLDVTVPTKDSTLEQEGTSKQKAELESKTTKGIENSDNSTAEKGFCPKCIEKGNSCLKYCPKRTNIAVPKDGLPNPVVQQDGKNVGVIEVPAKNGKSEPLHQEGTNKDATKILESSEESMSEKGFCSKCIVKGRVCLKECPRAKSDGNKGK